MKKGRNCLGLWWSGDYGHGSILQAVLLLSLVTTVLAQPAEPIAAITPADFENENDPQAIIDPEDAMVCSSLYDLGVSRHPFGPSTEFVANPYRLHTPYISHALNHYRPIPTDVRLMYSPLNYGVDTIKVTDCAFSFTNGWRYALQASCTARKSQSGLLTSSVEFAVYANKSSCFDLYESKPKTLHMKGRFVHKSTRTAVRSVRNGAPAVTERKKLSSSFCTQRGLLSAGFPQRVATGRGAFTAIDLKNDTKQLSTVHRAMSRVFNAWYRMNNVSHTCGPKPFATFSPVAACLNVSLTLGFFGVYAVLFVLISPHAILLCSAFASGKVMRALCVLVTRLPSFFTPKLIARLDKKHLSMSRLLVIRKFMKWSLNFRLNMRIGL